MKDIQFSNHAQRRMQQRGIPQQVIEWILEVGSTMHDHRGCRVHFMDKSARRRLARAIPAVQYRRFEKKLNAYLVESVDGTIVTAGYRHSRLRHH
jgi:hypothetical protein